MKGIVFREFVDMVETTFSPDMMDELIDATAPASGGAYTSVGTYDYRELIDMVVELSARTGVAVPELVRTFGHHLARVFSTKFNDFFADCTSTVEFLKTIDDHIHVEVKKLYPAAELPRFTFDESDAACFRLTYRSVRPFSHLAFGLIEGCIAHYDEHLDIEMEDLSTDDETVARFSLRPAA